MNDDGFPIDSESGRRICTEAKPMPDGAGGRWLHPDAKYQHDDDVYFDRYECPHCGVRFKIEMPD